MKNKIGIQEEGVMLKRKKNPKAARLIVRNLSFKSNEKNVKDFFSKFGDIVDIKLLKKGDKLVGCGFVQYENKLDAAKAIAKLNGNDFLGRPIIVDWALPKDKFNMISKPEVGTTHEKNETSVKEEDDDDEDETFEVSRNVELDKSIEDEELNVDSDDDEKTGHVMNIDHSEESEDESSEESGEDESGEDFDEENKRKISPDKSQRKHNFKYDPNDVADGRTVFLKNIPFSANDDVLLKCAESIGPVVYAIVCVDPLTEHSKGTGFVKFKDKNVVEDLLEGKVKLAINGIKLDPYLALKKNQIDSMKETKTPKDKRNLYLVREGVIVAGTSAAEGVSEGDMRKRLQLEHWKTQTLKNLNKFVSPIRLVIHNLPPFINDNKLRQIFKEHSPKGSIINEAKVMRNLKDIDEHGVGRSKGFGFVTFSKHEHALEALRAINNNPKIFKESKRPIVGFSIENLIALKIKEKRKVKSKDSSNRPTNKISGNKEVHKKNDKCKETLISNTENLPSFSGNVAKLGVKKMRSRKELSMQAKLHHTAAVEKKKSKKKFNYSKRFKSKLKGVKKTKK